VAFVKRERQLAALSDWWSRPNPRPAIVWGRRRVGKTALLREFARGRRTVFHTGAERAQQAEPRLLSSTVAATVADPLRDLDRRPYTDWDDALEHLARLAADEPLLLILDEFPELVATSPELPGVLRAFLDRGHEHAKLRILLCGSAVRVMEAAQDYRAPLYGRFDLTLLVHPFTPAEAALLLPDLSPGDRALVYCLLGGVPLYLSWWDQSAEPRTNLAMLACRPGAPLLNEAQLVLATEVDRGGHAAAVLQGIASGKTKHHGIKSLIRTEPARVLERLIELRLVERLQPVTDPPTSRRRAYRVTDNLLAFYLGVLDRYRSEINQGLGESILPVLLKDLDDHLGAPWEAAVRTHVRCLAVDGVIGDDIVAVGHGAAGCS
jgi:hypothetical protein